MLSAFQRTSKGACDESGPAIELRDGSISVVDGERRCPERLSTPTCIGRESLAMRCRTFRSTKKCDSGSREKLYMNVLLPGGATTILTIIRVKEVAPRERKFSG